MKNMGLCSSMSPDYFMRPFYFANMNIRDCSGSIKNYFSGDLKSGLVWILNDQKEVGSGFQMGSEIQKPRQLFARDFESSRCHHLLYVAVS